MSYDPTTDFLGLLRTTAGGVRSERMPGLDFVIVALARANFMTLHVGQTAPVANQSTTAWFVPATPSWTAEGVLFLWNSVTGQYETATPTLWASLISVILSNYSFQTTDAALTDILAGTSVFAVQRDNPAATSIVLPNLGEQFSKLVNLQIVDFSINVVNHVITMSTPDGATVMQKVNWQLLSTADQLAGIELQPVPELNSWIVAP